MGMLWGKTGDLSIYPMVFYGDFLIFRGVFSGDFLGEKLGDLDMGVDDGDLKMVYFMGIWWWIYYDLLGFIEPYVMPGL